ncbi:MAG: ferrous iron transporter B [Clostridia bacterium]|nr:ferrous iron transporter B [Clostridia bacterium]
MITIALAGNPNCGKTTLFNALTGATAHVGNWPGVTVDKREGVCKKGEQPVNIVDLPGIYSLSPYTPEEVIARNFILDSRPDCVINIVDSTNLERNLYLTTQLMEMDVPVVVALNMTDELDRRGDKIDAKLLEERLGLPVLRISALSGYGIKDLINRTIATAKRPRKGISVLAGTTISDAVSQVAERMKDDVSSPVFHAIKLIEGDSVERDVHKRSAAFADKLLAGVNDPTFGSDIEALVANARYDYITKNYSPALTRKSGDGVKLTKSDKIDRILTNKWAGIPIFAAILFAIFHLTFSEDLLFLGAIIAPFGEWCATITEEFPVLSIFFSGGLNSPGVMLFNALDLLTSTIGEGIATGLESAGAAEWAIGLVGDGILGGLFAVLSFLPQILLLFFFFSILEDSGYMARVAFILDRIFRRLGLSGRAFMPMIMGFGCSIPAMVNTRTLADEKERTATIRVIPFFSCGAKLPILTAMAGGMIGAFGLGEVADLIVTLMYLLGMVTAFIAIIAMRSTTMRGEITPFIMELPDYRAPGMKSTMLHLWDKAKHFIQKAFTIILASTIVIWFFSHFTWNWQFVPDENMDTSILASLGMLVQPIFTPLGFGAQLGPIGWVFAVGAVTGLIAKENVIATFGTLASAVVTGFTADEALEGVDAVEALISATDISGAACVAFIMFNMLTIPCFAAVAAAKAEVPKGKFKWTLLFWIASSYIAAAAIYTVGEFIWPVAIWAVVIAVATAGIIWFNKNNEKELKTA